MVASYFTYMFLKYDTKNGPREYKITGWDSVLGPLLWNIMYDGLLRLVLPSNVKLVASADEIAVVIVPKHHGDKSRIREIQETRRKVASIHHLSALRVTSAFHD